MNEGENYFDGIKWQHFFCVVQKKDEESEKNFNFHATTHRIIYCCLPWTAQFNSQLNDKMFSHRH